MKLPKKKSIILDRDDLSRGDEAFKEIPSVDGFYLQELGITDPIIISQKRIVLINNKLRKAYAVWFQSAAPRELQLTFLKKDQELYKTTICSRIPEDPIPAQFVKGWTRLKISLI